MSECLTHHHACDCREAKFAKLEADLAAAQRELSAHKQAINELRGHREENRIVDWIGYRVAELLAQEGVSAQPQYREPTLEDAKELLQATVSFTASFQLEALKQLGFVRKVQP